MENKIIVSPSVLSMDYSKMQVQMEELNRSNAEWIHFDVMDGHFVPNLSFGPDLLKGFRKMTNKVLDVHLMVSDPEKYVPIFIEAGADVVTFHVEALDNDLERISALMDLIHEQGVQGGVVIKPKTDVTFIEHLLPKMDIVLIMTVEPGFGGQSFMENMMDKVDWLHQTRMEKELSYRIEVDGGINEQTAQISVSHGADTLVAGSYVFNQDIIQGVDSLL
ncbi:MAG: ribulose-phosphate 3-epimerase [Erysipelotrichaceae bacterium]|nr:ribulose-phosphate 3-epimerase [Erysipelotrichaceae bacterium]